MPRGGWKGGAGQPMKLSSLASDVSMDVIRDGAFESLGLLSSPVASTLAALHDVSRAGDWQSNPSIACVITSENLASLVPDGVGLAIAPVPLETFLEAQRFLGTKTDDRRTGPYEHSSIPERQV